MKNKKEKLLEYITTAQALQILDESPLLSGVTWDSEFTGDPENQVCFINWHDAEGLEFSTIITEAGLESAQVSGNIITLNDFEGNEIYIALYNLAPINIYELEKAKR